MMAPDTTPPDKSPDRIFPGKPLEPADRPFRTPPSTDFESYMKGTAGAPTQSQTPGAPTPSGTPTPMEAAKGPVIPSTAPTFDSLALQAKNAQDGLGIIGQKLTTPNLKLKRAQSHLLRNKLQDANTYIRSAGAKLGVDAPPMKPPAGGSPVDRFIAYVNDGQEQLLAVNQKLKDMAAHGDELRPGDFLLVQVKMNLAQQEIEYSSTMLGKVIDSFNKVMSIQL